LKRLEGIVGENSFAAYDYLIILELVSSGAALSYRYEHKFSVNPGNFCIAEGFRDLSLLAGL